MAMIGVGVIEGFFGPEWPWEDRRHFCEHLRSYGGDFYIYAPKRDPYLRKSWTLNHPPDTWSSLKSLSSTCAGQGVGFGVGLSPFEIHDHWDGTAKRRLKDKIGLLEQLNLQYLGLFFDDMKGAPDLADKQLDIVGYIRDVTRCPLLFCPTYYSDDPILDKVFGSRSADYLEKIGTLPPDVHILWTGRKVISESISEMDLKAVAAIIRRKPVIWDNYFANDGPKQCKFLKLKPLKGRDSEALAQAEGWAFNLMNQPRLSEILFASAVEVLRRGIDPDEALWRMFERIEGGEVTSLFRTHIRALAEVGLDQLDGTTKDQLRTLLKDDGASLELVTWLDGKYTVGPECLTD